MLHRIRKVMTDMSADKLGAVILPRLFAFVW